MKTTKVLVYVVYAGLVCALNVERTGQEAEEKIFGKQDDANPTHQRSRQFFRYILRVVEILDHDEAFQKRSALWTEDSIKQGKLEDGLYQELQAVTRKRLGRIKTDLHRIVATDKNKQPDKIRDQSNPIPKELEVLFDRYLHQTERHAFSQKDLHLLLGPYTTLMAIKDVIRRQKFNRHEMDKELKYRESLKHASSEEERHTLEEKERHHHEKKHAKLHDPLHEEQLKEVWEKSDGLDPEYFDLKTLFKLHDKDSNSFLDEFELETLFLADLDKAYPLGDPDTDPAERDEEMNRMREYAMNNVDADKDGKLSLDEVLKAKSSGELEDEEEWHPLYGSKEFTEDELIRYKAEKEKTKKI